MKHQNPGKGAARSAVSSLGALATAAALTLGLLGTSAIAQDVPSFKVGVVSFLSGGASGPFGIPTRNAAEVIIDGINKGTLPAPYNTVGLGGAQISPIYVDETSKNIVADYRRLVEKEGVDAIVGFNSSGSCVAITPEVEKLKKLTIFTACGTPQVFEEIDTDPQYLFRAASTATMDSVGAARYVIDTLSDLKTFAGINQNYSWGLDSWRDFSKTIGLIKNDVSITDEQFPKLFAGQYGAEISALLASKPDLIHSSFWGGDVEAFIIQAAGRGLFARSQILLTSADTAIARLGPQIPDGTIIGARGTYNIYAPDTELNKWFRQVYFDRYGVYPVHPAYQMANALLGMKAAAEKAGEGTEQAIIDNLRNLSFDAPGGEVLMALANGHQAITSTAYGTYKFNKETGQGTVENVRIYGAECVNPPESVTSLEWIESGIEGANCR